jgi:hypothetical protein
MIRIAIGAIALLLAAGCAANIAATSADRSEFQPHLHRLSCQTDDDKPACEQLSD